MRLLVVSQDFPPAVGGVQTWTDRVARALARSGEVTVLAPAAAGDEAHDATMPCPVLRWRTPHTSAFGALLPLALPWALGRSGARVALCAQTATAGAALLARRAGLLDRYYVAAHGRELRWTPLGPAQRRWRRAILGGAAAVFAVSRFTAGLVRGLGVPDGRVVPAPNGVDLDRFRPVDPGPWRRPEPEGRSVVLSAGRLIRRKGVDTLLRACAALPRSLPPPALVVAGDGPDRPRLEALARGLGAPARFLGRVPDRDLPALYSAADLFVLAAREEPNGDVEGFGLVLLEAAACGTPSVASRSGGVPDAVDDGVSGLLVPPDDPPALAAALARVLSDDALRRRLSCGALARAARSGWEATVEPIARRLAEDEAAGRQGRAA